MFKEDITPIIAVLLTEVTAPTEQHFNPLKMDLDDKELLQFIENFNRQHSLKFHDETPARNDLAFFIASHYSEVCII